MIQDLLVDNYKCNIDKKVGFYNVPVRYIVDLLKKIDISPKNMKFNTSALIDFIRDYKGDKLKKWDIYFPQGESNKEIDLGFGYSYKYIKENTLLRIVVKY